MLRALEPAALELSLRAVGRRRAGAGPVGPPLASSGWSGSRHEAERAARQYHAAEPENRLVGRELERRWEQALLEQRQVEDEYDRFRRGRPAELTSSDVK